MIQTHLAQSPVPPISSRQIPFTKMHGLGNDFIILDDLNSPAATSDIAGVLSQEVIHLMCDRRFGIGADQILWLKKAHDSKLDLRMEILNSDGSSAEMCGNGIRAVGLYVQKYGKSRQPSYKIETLAGTQVVEVQGEQVSVNMGSPILGGGFPNQGEKIQVHSQGAERTFHFFEVNVGNPHAVIFMDQVSHFPLEEWGPLLERHPRFPKRTNVELVEIVGQNQIRVRVWERGAGITLACGTGACASAVASLATQKVSAPVEVNLPGGQLLIDWKGPSSPIIMKGPANEVFRGVFEF